MNMKFNHKESITVMDTVDKYIFWDIDGTLAPYRFNNHVGDPNGTNNGMSISEIENGIFLERRPSKHMQRVIKECNSKVNIIIGHCFNQKEIEDKQIWLDKYYPSIKKRFFILENISKSEIILKYCKDNNIPLDKVIFVDDVIPFLREAEKKGIESWHISSFLDWGLGYDYY